MGWIFWIVVGMFIGWNLPQPWYAAIVAWWKALISKKTGE